MNLSKHLSFFDPLTMLKGSIHIIGCGAVGSTVAEMLTRMGVVELHLWDFDIVSAHNLANQNFRHKDIGTPKVDALTDILTDINPDLKIIKHPKGYTDEPLSGYVFLCVDNIDLRREICKAQQYNPHVQAVFDFRIDLRMPSITLRTGQTKNKSKICSKQWLSRTKKQKKQPR